VDAKMLVVTSDRALAELLRPQVENQGSECTVVESYDEASRLLGWADSLIVDLELPCGGLDSIQRLQVESPDLRIIAIATNEVDALAAEGLGLDQVLREPFSIADVVAAVRSVATARPGDAQVIDLRAPVTGATETAGAALVDDRPWWATR
jgi:DNA-binding response OmpR family regulator